MISQAHLVQASHRGLSLLMMVWLCAKMRRVRSRKTGKSRQRTIDGLLNLVLSRYILNNSLYVTFLGFLCHLLRLLMSRFDHFCVTFLSRACYLLVGALSCCGACVYLEGWEVLQTGDLRINIEGQMVRRGVEYQTAAEIRAVRRGQVLQTGNTQDGQGKEQTCANAMVREYSRYNDISDCIMQKSHRASSTARSPSKTWSLRSRHACDSA